ncbi:hypothetical protein [Tsukamurella soli]|uniref:AI-2E family transporter n=1 Tax=Tsukamurella soli TaxID=644556 RepID=A0ABP8K9H7_9ACTN
MTNPGPWQQPGQQQWQGEQHWQDGQGPHGGYPQPGVYPAAPGDPRLAPVTEAYPPSRPAWFTWARNQCSIVAVLVAIVYIAIAETSHFVVIGIVPIAFAVRAALRREPLSPLAVLGALAAVVITVHALAG